MSDKPNDDDRSHYSLIAASNFVLQTWVFRSLVVVLAFVTVALCNWLIRDSNAPMFEAGLAATGLIAGFCLVHLFESRKYLK